MPQYLQSLAHIFPLYYLIQALNDVVVYNNTPQAIQDTLVLLALSATLFTAAVRGIQVKRKLKCL